MAKKKDDTKATKAIVKKIEKPLVKLNGVFNDVIDNISASMNPKNDKDLKGLMREIDDVVSQQLGELTQFTGNDISTFLVKLFNEFDNRDAQTFKDLEDVFSSDSNGLYEIFAERYKNNNLKYDDLAMICSNLYELEEAISTTRDSIVTADDVSQRISRNLKFGRNETDDAKVGTWISVVEQLEKKFKLPSKIKNHIVPKTLQYGSYYVYTIPYSKMFERYAETNQQQKMAPGSVNTEAYCLESFTKDDLTAMFENATITTTAVNEANRITESIQVYTDECVIPIVEGIDVGSVLEAYLPDDEFKKLTDKAIKQADANPKTGAVDGTIDTGKKSENFDSISGCYVKLIDPRKAMPMKVLDQTVAYLYVHDAPTETTRSPFTTNINFKNNKQADASAEQKFVSGLADKIVKKFDKKFLENNLEFKELIVNALMYNDLYKKDVKFQVIPVDYMTEFKVNEDTEGNGTSMLVKSLFYAKLFLALLLFKMITIVTKSNDTKINYVKQSGIDKDVAAKVQEVARTMKQRQINITDLLNYNSMISKIGANKEIFMPVGMSDTKGIEFDVIAGQDVALNTDLMDMLKTGYISASGVPSVIMNYVNEADYAKTLVMANSKYVGRVVTYQLDFNDSLTEVYKKIMRFCTDIPPEVIEGFEYSFNPPKSLNNMNASDLISNVDNVAAFMVKCVMGENVDTGDDGNYYKDKIFQTLAKELAPMLPWKLVEDAFENAKLELVQKKADDKAAPTDSSAEA